MNKSTETGLQDLLFNGAVACLLIFIIYAIKANGYAVISSLSSSGDTGRYQATASLPLETEKVEGLMISYRKVHIQGLSEHLIDQVQGGAGWEWQTNGEIEESVELVDNGLILSASFVNHPNSLKLVLSVGSSVKHNLSVYVIEGARIVEGRTGSEIGKCQLSLGGQSLSDLVVTFQLIPDFESAGVCNEEIIRLSHD